MWKHKEKYKGQVFKGDYETKGNGERIFNLTNGIREITFESWQRAVKAGWEKLNKKRESFWE